MKVRYLLAALLFAIAVPTSLFGQDETPFDFKISKTFLTKLADEGIQPVLSLKLDHRTKKVHVLSADCEIHIASTPQGWEPGDPDSVVVEPPNLCKFRPVGSKTKVSETALRETVWPKLLDASAMGKTCDVKGFPRIFTEHASGGEDPANPNHVFEIHPATSITCDGKELDFTGFVTAIKGMRAIKPATAASCVENRQLEVRFADGDYELRESGGQCGNFAIVEIGFLNPAWVHKVPGGHSAIAKVSLDGASRATLKIYTLAGSKADDWLAGVKTSGLGRRRILVHGMFSYDYFAILKAVRNRDGQWIDPTDWVPVKFPLALVLLGETKTVPWNEP